MDTQYILTPYFLDDPMPGLEDLAEPDWMIIHEDLPETSTQERMSVLHGSLATAVEDALREHQLPVSIAGDCCTTIGILAGLQRAGIDPLLIWFDAHGDFNTWETTPSGFIGGMPLAMLAGLGEQSLLDALDVDPLDPKKIILTDARDLDPGEEELLVNSDLLHLAETNTLLDHPLRDEVIWIHFDADIVNPDESPAQNYPAPGGPSRAELQEIFEYLREQGDIRMVSVSSWAPSLPGSALSKQVSLDLLQTLIKT